MELRIFPSDPQFEAVNFCAEWIAMLKNNHLFFDLKDISEVEKVETISALEKTLEELSH